MEIVLFLMMKISWKIVENICNIYNQKMSTLKKTPSEEFNIEIDIQRILEERKEILKRGNECHKKIDNIQKQKANTNSEIIKINKQINNLYNQRKKDIDDFFNETDTSNKEEYWGKQDNEKEKLQKLLQMGNKKINKLEEDMNKVWEEYEKISQEFDELQDKELEIRKRGGIRKKSKRKSRKNKKTRKHYKRKCA